MTIHLGSTARPGRLVASFPVQKSHARRVIFGASLAVAIAAAAIVMSVDNSSDVAPDIPRTEAQVPAPLVGWAVPASDSGGIEYSPGNPFVVPLVGWAVPASDSGGVEYSPANPYGLSATAPMPPIRPVQEGPR
jgi:hypothetical protein